MKLKDWRRIHAMNAAWRAWMAKHSGFVAPETIDTLRYMRGELAEAADAEMRQRLSKHPRNNGRDHNVYQELADAAMLALTALPDVDEEEVLYGICEINANSEAELLDWMIFLAADAVTEAVHNVWITLVWRILHGIAQYPGMALEQELRRCWWRLAWKHAGEAKAKCYPAEWLPFGIKE